jgi:hypothetical protein
MKAKAAATTGKNWRRSDERKWEEALAKQSLSFERVPAIYDSNSNMSKVMIPRNR